MVWVLLVVLLGFVMAAVVLYNRLVTARNGYRNAFAQIDVQLTRRHDLVPNLIEVARRYLQHERETLEAVISARSAAVDGLRAAASNVSDRGALAALSTAENALSGALGRLMAIVEAYPELKANETMAQLSEELASTENRVAFARQAFNDQVMIYNNSRETFPGNLVAGMFSFSPAQQLQIESASRRNVPQVSFG